MSAGWAKRRPVRTGNPYDAAWRRLRLAVLQRDGYQCQVRLSPRCTPNLLAARGIATVDHITALADGGARLDPANLRAACRACNLLLGAQLGRRRQRDSLTAKRRRWYP